MSDESPDAGTMWIASTFNAGNNIYHTDPDCHNLSMCASPRQIDREQAERKNARECNVCAGTADHESRGVALGANGFDARRYNGTNGVGDTDD